MADANTSLYGLVKPEVGASADSWGGKLNNDLDDTDALLGAFVLTGSSSAYVLTTGLSLAAYATKQRFKVQWNHTNASTSPTLNVDAIGAKNIKKRDGSTSPSASDLVSGRWNEVLYDGTNMVVTDLLPSDFQPYGAMLTAIEALNWVSGTPLISVTAADTVSLTLTPSVTSVTATTTSATSPGGTFVNTTDNASVRVLRLEGDRATPANNDTQYISFFMSDNAGNQDEIARQSARVTNVTSGGESGQIRWGLMVAGAAVADLMALSTTSLLPITNDALALGATTLGWSDLHLATGGTVNWANGLVVITHNSTTDSLEVTGGGFAAPFLQVTGVGGETLTTAHRNRELILDGNITMPNSVFAAGDWQVLIGDGSARTITRGSGVTMYVNGVDSATATLGARQIGGAAWETASVVYLSGAVT